MLPLTLFLVACGGDACDRLCVEAGAAVGGCRTSALSWEDLGARSRRDFVATCQDAWEASVVNLSSNELRIALDACDEAERDLRRLGCDEVMALYAPTP